MAARPGLTRRPRDRPGQALRLGDGGARHRPGAADFRWHGIDDRASAGAHVARCTRRSDLGRHQRDSAAHHRARVAPPVGGVRRPIAESPLRLTRYSGVLKLLLDRPPPNEIDAATSRAMGECFAAFRDDPALRVAIVTGAVERFFSAGWDLREAAQGVAPDSDYGIGGFGGIQQLPNLNNPVIAAVNGMAVGGGFELALSADLIIAAEAARFALPEARGGTIADAATIKLPRRIPYHVAMDMLFTGRWVDAQEALRWGLLKEIVPGGELVRRAQQLAHLLEQGPPLVFAALKEG